MKYCKKCVIPENFPRIIFNKQGVCNLCQGHKKTTLAKKKEFRKKFEDLIVNIRGKNEYDVLMCYSGGKDSTYTLNKLAVNYKLNVLAFTLDNGFIPERTYLNIRTIAEKCSADHILFKPRFNVIKKIFKASLESSLYPPKTLERASTLCTSCTGLVKYSALKIAIEKKIPLIAFGWSPGQAPLSSSILEISPVMMRSMERVLKEPMVKAAGKSAETYFLSERHYSAVVNLPIFIHPLAFQKYDESEILRSIQKLGWEKPADVEMNATNCLINPLADIYHIKKYKFHPYVMEIANFVREGIMTREEAFKHLPVKKDPVLIKKLKKRLEI